MIEKVDDQLLHYSWNNGPKFQRYTTTTKNSQAVLMELPPFFQWGSHPSQSLKLDFSHIKLHTGKRW